MSKLEVIQPGVLSQFQDLGRYGASQLGLSQGGAVDLHAYCWANRLLGNDMDAPVLEILLGACAFKAHSDSLMAIAGAQMNATIDGVAVKNWSSFIVKKGQVLKLGYATQGLRGYIAIKSGFFSSLFLNSSSTVIRNNIGGLARVGESFGHGNKLESGDFFSARSSQPVIETPQTVTQKYIPSYLDHIEVRVIPSYQYEEFSDAAIAAFFNHTFTITNQSDRMGIRLSGPAIECDLKGIISEGIALGSIQIPPDGQPIILLNDRQTLGGYPKIGCICKTDISQLAQAKAGTTIRFVATDFEQSSEKWIDFSRFFGLEYHRSAE
ncbi:biotin-dependent carboxyltransferase family protein [Aliivibrio kagoshimensis]|uniref:5-oxoprolinase subunit C family protein n=1 Tax=Aliivibrio kagoshimensis TaxID=2910230 RepID=UPI003D0A2BDA